MGGIRGTGGIGGIRGSRGTGSVVGIGTLFHITSPCCIHTTSLLMRHLTYSKYLSGSAAILVPMVGGIGVIEGVLEVKRGVGGGFQVV